VLVAIKIVGTPGWQTLFDNSKGDASPTFKPSFRNINLASQGFGASSQAISPLSNALVNFSIPFTRTYSSYQLALQAIRVMRTTYGGVKVHLNVVQDGESQYYPNGSLESMEANLIGCSVDFTMVFQTQEVTATAPST
jgi:hypothetical protein